MARSRKNEQRELDADEAGLVARLRHPDLAEMPDSNLHDLVRLIRERRDRARDIASRQRREMRGKAAPSGAEPASGDSGTRRKLDVLAAALKRAGKEVTRRRGQEARSNLVDSARRALAMKQEAGSERTTPAYRTSNEGMAVNQNDTARLHKNIDEGSAVVQREQSHGARISDRP